MKKKTCAIAAAVMCGLMILQLIWHSQPVAVFAAKKSEKPIYCVETEEKRISISFDAAWGADQTEKLLDILDAYGVKTTFFLVGFWAEAYPDMVRLIHERGHEIGNHSQNHPQMSKLTKEQMEKELRCVNDTVESLTGVRPCVFRPPYGDYNDLLVRTVRNENMHAIQWSIDSLDWKEYGAKPLVERVLKKVEPGDIILFHNNARYTPEALPTILESLQNRGFEIVPVGELIYQDSYSVDQQGIQHRTMEENVT